MIQDFVGITGMAEGITGTLMLSLEKATVLQKYKPTILGTHNYVSSMKE